MPDDQVTIDPEFLPSPPRTGWTRWMQIGAVAAAAFILGWLLRLPTAEEPDTPAVVPSTTTLTRETTSPIPPSTTTFPTTPAAPVGLEVPLGEAVAGFADAITVVVAGGVWGEEVDVVRWLPSQAAPETIVSFRENSPDEWEWFVGLDAAGTWYAIQDEYGVLSVRPVAAVAEADDWWEPTREVVGLRVVGAAWHDTALGRLAWLSCTRAPDGPATLYTLDVTDQTAEPVAVTRLSDACDEFGMWLNNWGDWGFALERTDDSEGSGWGEPNTWTVMLDHDGVEITQIENAPGGARMVAGGPAGIVWNEESMGGATSFLLSLDGQRSAPMPGLANEEWVEQAEWSPDGSRIALVVYVPRIDRSLARIVDATTGETIDEIDELGPVVFQTRWSSDGRYLLVGHDRDDGGAAGAALVVYDLESETIAIEEPFRDVHYFSEIRTFEPSSIAMQFTPLDWGIALEEGWGPGVYTVRMNADARPLLGEQIEGFGGKLVWDETVVDLCNIGIDGIGGGFVRIGDIFQTVEGCGTNPTAMQDAFDEFGLPELACLVVTTGGVDHEYCAPLGTVEGL